jgi:hypothetical protein
MIQRNRNKTISKKKGENEGQQKNPIQQKEKR